MTATMKEVQPHYYVQPAMCRWCSRPRAECQRWRCKRWRAVDSSKEAAG